MGKELAIELLTFFLSGKFLDCSNKIKKSLRIFLLIEPQTRNMKVKNYKQIEKQKGRREKGGMRKEKKKEEIEGKK